MKVLLVDEHPTTRLGLRVLLDGMEGAEVVGEGRSAEEALHLSAKLRPDLVVLDLELEGEACALWACRELKSLPCPPRVLIYTTQNSREDVAAASLAGADGYLYKGTECEKLPEAISAIHGGQRIWLLGPVGKGFPAGLGTTIDGADLTPKEGEVLILMMNRRTNREIAEKLYLSRNTVKTHVRSILRKLGFRCRRELFEVHSS